MSRLRSFIRRSEPMSLPEQTPHQNRPLLSAAQAAIKRGEIERADELFLQHIEEARDDALGLGTYGVFCLRTGRAATALYLLCKANALQPGDSELLSHIGYAHVELQDFEVARHSFQAVLAQAPGDGIANYGLALCLRHEGSWTAAANAFEKALIEQSDQLPILLNLADACDRAGDKARARLHFANAQRIAPGHPAMLLAYSRFLREQGEASQAMQLIDRLAQLHPNEAPVILEKARCLRAMGDPMHAMRWLNRLAQLAPDLPECSEEYGNCLQGRSDPATSECQWLRAIDRWVQAGKFALAESLLDRLLGANPSSAAGWYSRGNLENARHELVAAERAYLSAIEIDSALLEASANLTLLYESTNRVAEAKGVSDNALRFIEAGRGQQHGTIELLLASCKVARRLKDYKRGLELLDRAEALGPSDSQRIHLGLERGKLLDLSGDISNAVAAFALGNELAMTSWQRGNPGRNKALAGVEYMLDLIGKGWLRKWKPVDQLPSVANLAFLIGFPRSGTTLLNQVLGSHSAIQTMEEKPPVQKIMDAVRNMPSGYPHAISDFDAFDITYLRAAYFRSARMHGASDPTKLVFDKFPMHITLAGLLHRVFPQAQFVLALRHPCDVVLSCFMQDFNINNTMANFCTLADTVAMYTGTMDLWQAYRDQLPLSVHTIRYEDVVDDFDGQVRSLCEFLCVPWEDSLRQFATRALERGRINTPSYEQVSNPIYREARFRWERYRDHLEPYLPALQPYIERFGYSV
jgi:tetratricopeptide (TPR) repeat protein